MAIANVVSPRERGRYQVYMASTWAVACVAGPILGGWVTEALSWRWIFWVNLPLAAIAMVLCDRSLKVLKPRAVSARIDWIGALLLTATISVWLLVLSWGGVEVPWLSTTILALVATGVGLIALLVFQERRATDPLLPPRLFANSVFVRGVLIAFFGALGLFAASFLLPLFFQLVWGLDAATSGILLVPFLGFSCVGAYCAGTLARRRGKMKAIMVAGLCGCVVGFLMLAVLDSSTPRIVMIAYQVVLGFCIGMIMPSSLVCVQNAADRRDVGSATGSVLFLRTMGGAFGSTLVGALLANGFATRLMDLGVAARIDLGEVRHAGGAIAGVPAAMMPQVQVALAGAFHMAFFACAVLMAVAVVVALGIRDLPLRTAPANEPAEPAALAH